MKLTVMRVVWASVVTAMVLWASGVIPAIIPAAVPTASKQGNGAKFQLSTGSTATNNCVKFDANGNTVDAGGACTVGGGSGTVSSGTQFQVGQYTGAGTTTTVAGVSIPNCIDTGGQHVNFTLSTGAFSCGTSVGTGLTVSGFYLTDGVNFYVGPTFQPATKPTGLAWVNQGGATLSTFSGAEAISVPLGAGDNIRLRTKAIGANTIATFFLGSAEEPNNFRTSSVAFRESATGKLETMGLAWDSGWKVDVARYTSPTTFSSTVSSPAWGPPFSGNTWFRLEFAGGTTLNYYVSNDGVSFVKIYSEAKAAFFTTAPDEWGFSGNANNSSVGQSSNTIVTLYSMVVQ